MEYLKINYKGKELLIQRLPNGKFKKPNLSQFTKTAPACTWLEDCRIPSENPIKSTTGGLTKNRNLNDDNWHKIGQDFDTKIINSRFPANLLVSDDALNDGKIRKGEFRNGKYNWDKTDNTIYGKQIGGKIGAFNTYNDSGSYSRYFSLDKWYEAQFIITPKASSSERNKGLENSTPKAKCDIDKMGGSKCTMKTGSGNERNTSYLNFHPTVKPLKLFSYLITMGSRESDIILDPFIGSGTTAIAAYQLNRKFIGIEKNPEYYEIAQKRIKTYTVQTKLI